MHGQILSFAKSMAGRFSGRVLEVGSYNVNGTVRDSLPITVGVDMAPGPCVDEVVRSEDVLAHFGPESFDHVVSCDALEHIELWRESMEAMWGVLKPGGCLLLTMAAPTKGRHGYPNDYWRMPMPMFLRMFADNEVVGTFEGRTSLGACVVKSGPLFLDFEPDKVK